MVLHGSLTLLVVRATRTGSPMALVAMTVSTGSLVTIRPSMLVALLMAGAASRLPLLHHSPALS